MTASMEAEQTSGIAEATKQWVRNWAPSSDWDGHSFLTVESKAIAVARLGESASDWASELAQISACHIIETMPELGGGQENEILRGGAESVINLVLYRASGFDVATAPSEEALSTVQNEVRRGIRHERTSRAIHMTHADLVEAVLKASRKWTPPSDLLSHLDWITEVAYGVFDQFVEEIMSAFHDEMKAWQRTAASIRWNAVTRLMDGSIDTEEAERQVGYRINARHHIGIITSPTEPGASGANQEKIAKELIEHAGCGNVLQIPVSPTKIWTWGSVVDPNELAVDSLEPVDGFLVAVGAAGFGIEGFLQTHREAGTVMELIAKRDPSATQLVRFDEVAVPALMSADPAALYRFVMRELGPLGEDSPYMADLRESLLQYFNTERSLVTTASRMHIARNTVTYRIRRAEELLARPIGVDHHSLHTALVVAQTIGVANLQPM